MLCDLAAAALMVRIILDAKRRTLIAGNTKGFC
jgi:hypothetical protein